MKSDDLGILTFRTPLHELEPEYAKPSRGNRVNTQAFFGSWQDVDSQVPGCSAGIHS